MCDKPVEITSAPVLIQMSAAEEPLPESGSTLSNSGESLKQELERLKDEYQDNTEYIRKAKNSVIIRDEILAMERLKRSYKGDLNSEEFTEMCRTECRFLYDNYMFLFNRLLKDVLNLKMMFQFLHVLKQVEDGVINQDEGSVIVGQLLKDIYLDCAIREADRLDQKYAAERPPPPLEGKSISWKQYKARQ